MENISVNFKKENGNILLESIDDNGEKTPYTSEKPLLTVNDDGSYSKVENADLNEIIISSVVEEPVTTDTENVEMEDVYKTNEDDEEKFVENPLNTPVEEEVKPEIEAAPTKPEEEVKPEIEAAPTKPEEEVKQETEAPSTNKCDQTFNEYNDKINDIDCNTFKKKDFKKLALKVHPDKNPDCGDASKKSFQLLNNKQEQCENQSGNSSEANKESDESKLLGDGKDSNGGKKNKTKKSKKGGKQKTKRVRFIITRKGRKNNQNKKNKTRR